MTLHPPQPDELGAQPLGIRYRRLNPAVLWMLAAGVTAWALVGLVVKAVLS